MFINKLASRKKLNNVEQTLLDATIYGKELNNSLFLSFNTTDNSANAYMVKGFPEMKQDILGLAANRRR